MTNSTSSVQRDKMTERIDFLEQSRDALTRYIDAMDLTGQPLVP